MQRQRVASSSLASVGYDASCAILEIEFRKGPVYRYEGVPEFLFQGLMLSSSKGQFFRTRIVGRYPYREV